MNDTVDVTIDSEGSISFKVDRREFEEERARGTLDQLFDAWASDIYDHLSVAVDGEDLTGEVYG